MGHLGKHLLAEYWGCDKDILASESLLQDLLNQAAQASNLSVLGTYFKELATGEVVGVLILSESHMSIHAWPETGYAAVDLYSVGRSVPERAHSILRKGLGSQASELLSVKRGDSRGMEIQTSSWRPVTGQWLVEQDAA